MENAVTKATEFLKSINWKREDVQKKVTAVAFGAVGIGLCYLAWKSKRSVSGTAGDDDAATGTEKSPNLMSQNKQTSKESLKKQKEKSSKKAASKARSSHRKKTGGGKEVGGKESTSSPTKPKKATSKSGATADVAPLTKSRLIAIFGEIWERMRIIMQRLSVEERKVREDALAKNMLVDEQVLQRGMLNQFWESMTVVEMEVYERHGASEEAVKIAAEKFGGDEEVRKSVQKLRQFYAIVSKSPEQYPDVPSHLTKERVMAIMDSMMKQLTVVMENICKEVKKENGCSSKDELLALLDGPLGPRVRTRILGSYTKRMKDIQRQLHEEHDIPDPQVLQAAMISFQNHEDFREHTLRLTKEQEHRFQELGFSDVSAPSST